MCTHNIYNNNDDNTNHNNNNNNDDTNNNNNNNNNDACLRLNLWDISSKSRICLSQSPEHPDP